MGRPSSFLPPKCNGALLAARERVGTIPCMNRVSLMFIGLVAAAFAMAQSPVPIAPPARPIAGVAHVVIISVDGLRPDRLLLADAPVLRGLITTGTYSMWARTTAVAVTLPSHTSMLTGVTPRKHKIEWNRDLPLREPVYPVVPTIFEMATKAGLTAVMIAGKSKLDPLAKPGTLAHAFLPPGEKGDNALVLAETLKAIEQRVPDLLFVHLPDVDTAGHAHGWGSREQLAIIAATDRQIAQLLAVLERMNVREKTVVIISADHGGAGLSHGHVGPDDGRSRFIPWVANGPGVRAGFDLTQIDRLQIDTEDTCATACWLLGLALPAYFDGKPIREAFTFAAVAGTQR